MPAVSSILNADLHCHSIVSDGTLTPEELALRASACVTYSHSLGWWI